MSLLDKQRPKVGIDYSKDWCHIAEQWRVAYFLLDRFAIKAAFRSDLWRYAAIWGWATVAGICASRWLP